MFKKKGNKDESEAANIQQKKKRFKKRYLVVGAAVLAVAGVIFQNVRSVNQPMPVKVKKIGYGDLKQTVDASGTVDSEEIKNYFAKTAAQIEQLDVELGGTVKKGDRLVTYNVEKLEQAAKQAELEAKASEYGIDATVTGLNYSQQKSAKAAKDYDEAVKFVQHYSALVSEIKDELSKAAKAAGEVESLTAQLSEAQAKLKEKPTSEKLQTKVSELATELQKAQKEAAKYDTVTLNASLETCSSDLAAYESLKAQYEAQKEADPTISSQRSQQSVLREVNQLAQEQTQDSLALAKEGVAAEFDGIVTAIGAVEGQSVMEGSELFTIANDKKIKVSIDVSKYDLEKIQLNQKAIVTINNKEYEGYVAKIERFAHMNQSGAKVLGADIHIENPDDNIYLGIEGKVSIETASLEHVLLLPMECINSDTTGDFCYCIENGTVVRKDLELGISSALFSEVRSGLQEGDSVVSEVTTDMEEGMSVTPVEDEPEENKP